MPETIQRLEDGNERSRENKYGNIRESKSNRVIWCVYDDGEFLAEFDRLKDAKRKYPNAVLIKE